MDVNATLREIRELYDSISELGAENAHAEADALAEKVQALDNWLMGGGFLPAEWQR